MVSYNRMLDSLNRVVIPLEFRKSIGVDPNSAVTISCQDGKIIIEPQKTLCRVCGSGDSVNEDIPLCAACLAKAHSIKI